MRSAVAEPDCPVPKPEGSIVLSKEEYEAVHRKKKSMKDISTIQKIYGKSSERCVDRQVELRRKIQRVNFQESPTCLPPEYVEKISQLKWKSFPWLPQGQPGQDFNEINYNWVDSNSKYWAMHEKIRRTRFIALDIEASEWDSYSGMICLIQVSTRSENYLIDALAIPQEIAENFKKILENPNILKIMHGARNDVKWLQRDFNIYLNPLFDTQCMVVPDSPEPDCLLGFADLVSKTVGVFIPKIEKVLGQLSDYTVRPLHEDLRRYACNDSRLLIHVYFGLKGIIDFEGTFNSSCDILKSSVWKGKAYTSAEDEIPEYLAATDKAPVFKMLHEYRLNRAKLADKPPQTLLPTKILSTVACGMKPPAKCNLKDELLYVAKNKTAPIPKNCSGLCFRCGKRSDHRAAQCEDVKAKKADMEAAYYREHPEKKVAEKERRRKKRSFRRQAIYQSRL